GERRAPGDAAQGGPASAFPAAYAKREPLAEPLVDENPDVDDIDWAVGPNSSRPPREPVPSCPSAGPDSGQGAGGQPSNHLGEVTQAGDEVLVLRELVQTV